MTPGPGFGWRYQLYGQSLHSAIELPELAATAAVPGAPNLWYAPGRVREPATWRDYSTLEDGSPWIEVGERADATCIRFPGLAQFELRDGTTTIAIVGEALGTTPDLTVRHLLIDQVVPTAIGWSGATALHGGAVAIGDRAIAVLGVSGIGKSTLVASFGANDGAILTDDCIVITESQGRHVVHPSYPSIRLHPSAASALLPDDAGSAVAHYNLKRRYSGLRFAPGPARLAGVLTIIDAPAEHPDRIEIQPLAGHRAFLEIMDATFAPLERNAARLLDRCTELAESTPIGRITVPNDLSLLPAVRATIAAWCAATPP